MTDEQNQPTLTDLWSVVQEQRQEMEAQRAEIAALTSHRRRRLLGRAIPRRGVMVATSLVLAVGLVTATPFTWIANGSPAASSLWSIVGNAGTNPSTNFLGTTDNQALVVKTNNAEAMRVLPGGNVGVGTSTPAYKLDVNGSVHVGTNDIVGGSLGVGTTSPTYKADVTGTLHASGNAIFDSKVGIGTTAPNYTLDASGDINASGDLRENGTTLGNKYLKLDGTNAPSAGVPISITGNTGGNAAGFTGNLAGDVTGTQGATHVSKLQGKTLSASTPTSGQVLTYDGSQWAPASAHVGSLSMQSVKRTVSVACCAGNIQDFDVTCPSGSTITGGGFAKSTDVQDVIQSYSNSSSTWHVEAEDPFGPDNLDLYANCVTFSP